MAKNILGKAVDALGFGSDKPSSTKKVEAFCLRDSGFGNAGEVVTLPEADAKIGEQHGMLDLNKAAIAAAKNK
jgi:hypothetical protein